MERSDTGCHEISRGNDKKFVFPRKHWHVAIVVSYIKHLFNRDLAQIYYRAPAIKNQSHSCSRGPVGVRPEESHEDVQRAGAPLLWSQAEGAGGGQPGEGSRKTLEHLPLPKGSP